MCSQFNTTSILLIIDTFYILRNCPIILATLAQKRLEVVLFQAEHVFWHHPWASSRQIEQTRFEAKKKWQTWHLSMENLPWTPSCNERKFILLGKQPGLPKKAHCLDENLTWEKILSSMKYFSIFFFNVSPKGSLL